MPTTDYYYRRRMLAAERVAMRLWLRKRDIAPAMGSDAAATGLLQKQVFIAGGDPEAVMAEGRQKSEDIVSGERKGMCDE